MAQNRQAAKRAAIDIFASNDPDDIAAADERIYALIDSGVRERDADIRLGCSQKRVREAISRRPPRQEAPFDPTMQEDWQLPWSTKSHTSVRMQATEKPGTSTISQGPVNPQHALPERLGHVEMNDAMMTHIIDAVLYHAAKEFNRPIETIFAPNPTDTHARAQRYAILLMLDMLGIPAPVSAPRFGRTPGMANYLLLEGKRNVQANKGRTRALIHLLARSLKYDLSGFEL